MSKKELIAFVAVIVLAIAAFIIGLISGIPKDELFLHPEFDIPFGIAMIILIILRIRVMNKKDDDKE